MNCMWSALMFRRGWRVSVYHAVCKSVQSGLSLFPFIDFRTYQRVQRWFYILVLNQLGCLTAVMLSGGAWPNARVNMKSFDQASQSTVTELNYSSWCSNLATCCFSRLLRDGHWKAQVQTDGWITLWRKQVCSQSSQDVVKECCPIQFVFQMADRDAAESPALILMLLSQLRKV